MLDLPIDRRLDWQMPTPEVANGRPNARDIKLEDSDLKRKIIKGVKTAVVAVAAVVGITEGAIYIGNDELQILTQSVDVVATIGALGLLSLRAVHAVETGHPD